MKTKTVMVPVEIPVGYDLDDGKQPRIGKTGEIACNVRSTQNQHPYELTYEHTGSGGGALELRYILVKEWEPTSGKAYMASNRDENVGTSKGYIVIFKRMIDSRYADAEGVQWDHCWPIPVDMVGE